MHPTSIEHYIQLIALTYRLALIVALGDRTTTTMSVDNEFV